MKLVIAMIQPSRIYPVLTALHELPDAPGVIVTESRAFPRGHSDPRSPSHGIDAMNSFEIIRLEAIVPDALAGVFVEEIRRAAHTGNPRDGKIFVIPVEDALAIRTGVRGEESL
jgi:nitrogen regulatory protein PII